MMMMISIVSQWVLVEAPMGPLADCHLRWIVVHQIYLGWYHCSLCCSLLLTFCPLFHSKVPKKWLLLYSVQGTSNHTSFSKFFCKNKYTGLSALPATSFGIHWYDGDTFGTINDFVPAPVNCKNMKVQSSPCNTSMHNYKYLEIPSLFICDCLCENPPCLHILHSVTRMTIKRI